MPTQKIKAGYIDANGSSEGQVLTSNGSFVYWANPSGGGGGGGGASVSVQSFPPLSPSIGDLWWNTTDGNLKVYYQGNSGFQWVDASLTGDITYNIANNAQSVAFSLVFGGF